MPPTEVQEQHDAQPWKGQSSRPREEFCGHLLYRRKAVLLGTRAGLLNLSSRWESSDAQQDPVSGSYHPVHISEATSRGEGWSAYGKNCRVQSRLQGTTAAPLPSRLPQGQKAKIIALTAQICHEDAAEDAYRRSAQGQEEKVL